MIGLALTENQETAVQLLGKHTTGTFAIWNLAAYRHGPLRAEILSLLKGVPVSREEAGMNVLFEALMDLRGQTNTGSFLDRETNLVAWLKLADDYRDFKGACGYGDPHCETAYDAILHFNFAPYGGLIDLNGWIGCEDFEYSAIDVKIQDDDAGNVFIVEFKPGTAEVTWVGIVPASIYFEGEEF